MGSSSKGQSGPSSSYVLSKVNISILTTSDELGIFSCCRVRNVGWAPGECRASKAKSETKHLMKAAGSSKYERQREGLAGIKAGFEKTLEKSFRAGCWRVEKGTAEKSSLWHCWAGPRACLERSPVSGEARYANISRAKWQEGVMAPLKWRVSYKRSILYRWSRVGCHVCRQPL